MILGFKQQFPWGEPTYFMEKILYGVGLALWITPRQIKKFPKIHTIRAGNRWKAGDKIHMAYGVRSKGYQQFNKGIAELEFVKSVQNISIKWYPGDDIHPNGSITVGVDGKIIDNVNQLALNDGFDDLIYFMKWFNEDFTGQIIHWTNLRY